MHFHILGGNSTYNRGDRLNLCAQIRLLRDTFPTCTISVSSFDPGSDARWHDAQPVKRGMVFLSRAERSSIRQADCVIWGGGALIVDHAGWLQIPFWILQLIYIRLWIKKPIMAWAHGVVLQTRLGKLLAPLAYNCCSTITVRDLPSLSTLKALRRIRPPIQCTADPALLTRRWVTASMPRTLRLPEGPGPLIAIAPTFWPLYNRPTDILPYQIANAARRRRRATEQLERFIGGLSEICSLLQEQCGARVLLIAHYPHPRWPDGEHLCDVRSRCGDPERIAVLRGDDISCDELAIVWKQLDGAITHSFHHTILSIVSGTPCLQLSYESKGTAFFEELHIADALLPWDAIFEDRGPATIVDTFLRLQRGYDSYRRRIGEGLPRLQVAATSNASILRTMLTRSA